MTFKKRAPVRHHRWNLRNSSHRSQWFARFTLAALCAAVVGIFMLMSNSASDAADKPADSDKPVDISSTPASKPPADKPTGKPGFSALPSPTPTGHKTGLIPREVLFGNPEKAAARMSHDGKWLSFLAPVDGVLNVWVAPIDDPAAAKAVTHEKDRPIHSWHEWAFTNQHILYEQDLKGDENFHVYAVEIPSGETRDLTPRDADKQVRAGIEEISYKFPHELLIALNDRDPQYHDIYRVDILTGKKKLVQENNEFAGFVTDEDFREFASPRNFHPTVAACISSPMAKEVGPTSSKSRKPTRSPPALGVSIRPARSCISAIVAAATPAR